MGILSSYRAGLLYKSEACPGGGPIGKCEELIFTVGRQHVQGSNPGSIDLMPIASATEQSSLSHGLHHMHA